MQVLKRLFGYVTPYWKILALNAVLLVGRAGMELVPPLFQREIVDEVIGTRDLSRLGLLIGLLVGVYALIATDPRGRQLCAPLPGRAVHP